MSKKKNAPRRFIGGHYDGALMVCDNDYVVLPEKRDPCAGFIAPGEIIPSEPIEYHCYGMQRLRGGQTVFEVMTPPSMSGDDIISRLLAGYNP